jgi:hypothetical protein
MVKIVDMTSALQQVREKAPDTADAMKRHKAGNAGFTDKAHLKAKGLIPRADGTKKVSPKYEETCPKCEGEECQCPTTMEITNADKMINTTAYQNYKSGDENYHPAEDLEEQKRILEEQLKNAEKELEELYIKEEKAYVIRFQRIADKERMVVIFTKQSEADMYADNIKKQGGKVFSNKLEKIPMGYKLVDKKSK